MWTYVGLPPPTKGMSALEHHGGLNVQALSDALHAITGVEIDPGAIRDALRNLVGR